MNQADRNFGGRVRPKAESSTNWDNLVEIHHRGTAFVYLRLSTYEQLKKHLYSLQAQVGLADLAKQDGYSDEQIHVERRDLGLSGTLGWEEREGLAYLISQIETDAVESVYVVQICRLFRDQTLINAYSFGELCKQHNVLIITPQMRLNLNDRMHMRIYRLEAERAADELDIMKARLQGGQNLKARQGFYGGSSLPLGYVLDVRKQIEVNADLVDNPNYHKLIIFETHAEIIRHLFRMARIPGTTVAQIVRHCRNESIVFSPFPEELASVKANLKSLARTKRNSDGSWPLTFRGVRSILQNPVYIGWWVWAGEVVKTNNHPAIIDEEIFWAVQESFHSQPHRPRGELPPLPLSGILYCGLHEVPKRMVYSNKTPQQKRSNYQCRDDFNDAHLTIIADYLDGPIGEAVVSQCAYPELAGAVIERLTQEYEETKTRTAAFSREYERLVREIENLEYNFANASLTSDRAAKIELMIQERLARLKELSHLEGTEIGKLVGPAITQDDVELVQRFLSNLAEGWEVQPSNLKNAFLRLVLDRVTIWPSPNLIMARLTWRTGLEQDLAIHRPYFEPHRRWSDEEVEVLKKHFETMPRDELADLLLNKTWRQIRAKGLKLGLKRPIDHGGGGYAYEPWEDEILQQHYRGELSLSEVLARLDRTEDSVRCRMRHMGLKRRYDVKPQWEWVENTNVSTIEHPSGQAKSKD